MPVPGEVVRHGEVVGGRLVVVVVLVVQLVRVGFGRVRGPDGYVLSV